MKGRLFLIDGSSLVYRAFYAIRSLSTSKGQPTNAVYGVVAMLRKLLEEDRPEYLAVALDVAGPTFRHRRYEKYKAHRPAMPQPLVDQIPLIKEMLEAFRIPIFEMAGYEADDILGTLALQGAKERMEVFLVTSDKDALQLLGPRIRVYRPTRDGHEVMDARALFERWRVTPEQVVEVMALMGDATDAIPGVPGIGEKTAVSLIQAFGSVKKLLKALEEGVPRCVRPHVAEALRRHAREAELSRELAQLDLQVPVELDLERLRVRGPDEEKLRDLYRRLEFRTFLEELGAGAVSTGCQVRELDSVQALRALVPQIRSHRRWACVIHGPEAGEKGDLFEGPLQIGLAVSAGSAWVLRWTGGLREIGLLFQESKEVKVCPDLKQMWVLLERAGLAAGGDWVDPELASYLLDPGRPSHRVADLAQEFLGESIAGADPAMRAGLEAEAALRLAPRLEKEVEEKSLGFLMREVELPLARVLARMEVHGMRVDLALLGELSKQIQQACDQLTRQIHRLGGGPFNLNSPRQLARVLFEELKLPVIKRTKTGLSTDEEVLRRLSPHHALPQRILEYRELSKLGSTYLEALPRLVDPRTGCLHATFHQTVTATGRLSASNPNLQNIPIRTELGRRIRQAFVPTQAGHRFLAADYSQIELRILAHLSEDPALVEAFSQGQDIHRLTAAQIFHLTPEGVDDRQRAAAKAINFGILYGMTPFGLAKELEVESAEAEAFIERYFSRFPGVRRYLDRSLAETRRLGYCTTLFRRRRYLPELSARQATVRQFAERMALNAPIQGSAADLIKAAMVAIDRALEQGRMRSRMVCQVHDELIFEAPPEELAALTRLVREAMETPRLAGRPLRLKVPIVVNVKEGDNWLEASHL